MSDLERMSQGSCAAALRRYGFVAKKRGLLTKSLDVKGVTGWLGLNAATWDLPASVAINPVVGVRHIRLEKALVELAGWPAPVACPTKPLGYLMPQGTFTQWDFVRGADLETVAEELAAAVAEYGMPFVDQWSDWKTLSSGLANQENSLLLREQRSVVLPVVAMLDGDEAAARAMVSEELIRVGDAPDFYSQSYREFARRLFP
ncbi:hypothetical protein [Micromonospora sp. DT31]|uniref:hypothetical protein n=1 Tax=Micromonospora sp. DT31 TaxID=3393434 RepID=UPI003CEB2700